MVVTDAAQDDRFFDNPLVTGSAQVRFYAGVPCAPRTATPSAPCVFSINSPTGILPADADRLAELAKMAADRLELRRIEVASTRFRPPFASYAASLPSAVIWFDEHLQLLEWNQAAADMLGFPLDAKIGLYLRPPAGPSSRARFRSLITEACAKTLLEQVHFPESITITGDRGQEIPIGLVLLGWREAGRMSFEVIFKDANPDEQPQTGLDPLTGLANRGTFTAGSKIISCSTRRTVPCW